MKKILWIIILLFTIYIILIFKAPALANEIEKLLNLQNFNQKVIDLKNKLNNF
jgi:hypothetical protein